MASRRTTTGFLLLVVAAFIGFLILVVPPWLVDQYDRFADKGPTWARVYLATVAIGGSIFLGATCWILLRLWLATRRKFQRKQRRNKNPSELSRDQQQREIDENLAAVSDLSNDPSVPSEVESELAPLASKFEEKRTQQTLEIVAFGTVSSGKSSLLNMLAGRIVFQTDAKGGTTVRRNEIPWPGLDKVTLVDTPGLGEVDGQSRASVSAAAAKDADLVLVVVDGPMRESEFQLLERLSEMEKRILVCLNKEDWYEDEEREALLGQIAQQVKSFVQLEDIVAVRASPTRRTRIRMLADGSQSEEDVEVAVDIAPLAARMMKVVRQDGQDLLLANLLLQSRGMVEEARQRVQNALDQRAWSIVDKYMWGGRRGCRAEPVSVG